MRAPSRWTSIEYGPGGSPLATRQLCEIHPSLAIRVHANLPQQAQRVEQRVDIRPRGTQPQVAAQPSSELHDGHDHAEARAVDSSQTAEVDEQLGAPLSEQRGEGSPKLIHGGPLQLSRGGDGRDVRSLLGNYRFQVDDHLLREGSTFDTNDNLALNLACLHAGLLDAPAESARGRHVDAKLVGVDGRGQDRSSRTLGGF